MNDTYRLNDAYVVWCPALGQTREDGQRISAIGKTAAAEAWADWRDFSTVEFAIAKGTPAEVMVARDIPGATAFRFIVSGETVLQYNARLVAKVPA